VQLSCNTHHALRVQRTRHPNVVRFFGLGELSSGVPFIVMELVQHGSLRTYIRGGLAATAPPPRAWRIRLALLADVATGMAYLHKHGCLHRDLKSANILIGASKKDPFVVSKVSDFGTLHDALADRSIRMERMQDGQLRRSLRKHETGDGDKSMTAGVGTPMYMAPVSRG